MSTKKEIKFDSMKLVQDVYQCLLDIIPSDNWEAQILEEYDYIVHKYGMMEIIVLMIIKDLMQLIMLKKYSKILKCQINITITRSCMSENCSAITTNFFSFEKKLVKESHSKNIQIY